ncbi:MAG: hypothetical protein N2235_02385 [Fischerella sp.]|nr:hypothetical protein [Fischerella sp.]
MHCKEKFGRCLEDGVYALSAVNQCVPIGEAQMLHVWVGILLFPELSAPSPFPHLDARSTAQGRVAGGLHKMDEWLLAPIGILRKGAATSFGSSKLWRISSVTGTVPLLRIGKGSSNESTLYPWLRILHHTLPEGLFPRIARVRGSNSHLPG